MVRFSTSLAALCALSILRLVAATRPDGGIFLNADLALHKSDQVYATFAEGPKYLASAAVLAKSMHQLDHKHPVVILIRDDSKLAARASAIEHVMQKAGWKSRIELFRPRDIRFTLEGGLGWGEAWQRVHLWRLNVSRFVHLDADTIALRNLDDVMEAAEAPSFARRMYGCKELKSTKSRTPITNMFLAQPDREFAERLEEQLRSFNANEGLARDDGTIIPKAYKSFNLLQAEDLLYFDCLKMHNDSALHSVVDTKQVRVMHLGYFGRQHIARMLKDGTCANVAEEMKKTSRDFAAKVLQHWYQLYTSADVQAIINAAS